ncbi:DUF6616 family protein [Halomonas denitrificans]|nr:hypothetical protein [Halomonas denitrificans]
MYIYVEHWTPKQAWLDLSKDDRRAFFERMMPLIEKHEEMGIETLAMATVDEDTPMKSDHVFVSVFRMPDEKLARMFEQDIESIGWYEYFDQTNARGSICTPEEIIGTHIEI